MTGEKMDYRELLMKYINHVGEEEGITFLTRLKPDYISDAEWEELGALDEESRKYHKRI